MKWFSKTFNLCLEILFPKKCIGCGRTGEFICPKCRNSMRPASLVCPVCFYPSLTGEAHLHCGDSLDGMIGIFRYEGLTKEAIRLLKFRGVRSLAWTLVYLSGERIYGNPYEYGVFGEFLFSSGVEVTFVPMRAKKEKKRGYNQAELIARHLAYLAGKKPLSLLKKSKETRDQIELDGKERFENLKDSFCFSGTYAPEGVVLVDDVVTTGSTLRECAGVLKKAGVKKVWAFTIAKTQSFGG